MSACSGPLPLKKGTISARGTPARALIPRSRKLWKNYKRLKRLVDMVLGVLGYRPFYCIARACWLHNTVSYGTLYIRRAVPQYPKNHMSAHPNTPFGKLKKKWSLFQFNYLFLVKIVCCVWVIHKILVKWMHYFLISTIIIGPNSQKAASDSSQAMPGPAFCGFWSTMMDEIKK